VSDSIKIAGDDFDEAITRYMRKAHNLLIGERSAEELKINIGTVFERTVKVAMEIRGRSLSSGLPRIVTVTSDEMQDALKDTIETVINAIHGVLERTPPELAADISDRGIVLTGGGSLIYGLDKLINARTGINTIVAENAVSCVATGTGKYIDYITSDKVIEQKKQMRKHTVKRNPHRGSGI
jgi:rod shape-determining protein MreB